MSAARIAKRFRSPFILRPLRGRPNVSIIHAEAAPRPSPGLGRGKGGRREMFEKDWDKFEKDIADAFERVP